VAKAEWGTKRTCNNCGARFYDLSKSPATCPQCGTVWQAPKTTRPRRDAEEAPKPAPVREVPVEVEEAAPDEAVAEDEEEELIEDAAELEDEAVAEDIETVRDEEPD